MTTNSSTACWVCGSTTVRLWKGCSIQRPLEPSDLHITDSRYGLTLRLWQCENCGFIYADSVAYDDLVALYSQIDDPGYLESLSGRNLQMQWLVDQALRFRPYAKTMLDIGAGAGALVQAGLSRGLQAEGVEPSAALVEAARRRFGIELVQGAFPQARPSRDSYDMVFLVDVIEHVADPVDLLRACSGALSSGGVLIVVTPDVRSVLARILGKRWWHFRLAHVGYFGRRTLSLTASRAGLQPLHFFRARWFFPIGYLAERLTRYLPVGPVNRLAERTPFLRALYKQVVPLNLFDSWVAIMVHDTEATSC